MPIGTAGYDRTSKQTSAVQDAENLEPVCVVSGNGNWSGHYGKKYTGSSNN